MSRQLQSTTSLLTPNNPNHPSQWISSLRSSPLPRTFPRLSPPPPLPLMPTAAEEATVAALLPRRIQFPSCEVAIHSPPDDRTPITPFTSSPPQIFVYFVFPPSLWLRGNNGQHSSFVVSLYCTSISIRLSAACLYHHPGICFVPSSSPFSL
ncbi:hypothetical protein BC826DRAFT_80814 [Russula brevipes]|nr:hypothetical protein BC826DRAFT_80814 [Russula brevipes]